MQNIYFAAYQSKLKNCKVVLGLSTKHKKAYLLYALVFVLCVSLGIAAGGALHIVWEHIHKEEEEKGAITQPQALPYVVSNVHYIFESKILAERVIKKEGNVKKDEATLPEPWVDEGDVTAKPTREEEAEADIDASDDVKSPSATTESEALSVEQLLKEALSEQKKAEQ